MQLNQGGTCQNSLQIAHLNRACRAATSILVLAALVLVPATVTTIHDIEMLYIFFSAT